MNTKISIVIPVYNAEKYIKKCLKSILGQTYTNVEVILVNDGSTDNSLSIIKTYATTDARIKIVDKKNEGVSSARNTGLKNATGEYVLFVDSDDTIDLDTVEKLANTVEHKDVDGVIFGYKLLGMANWSNDTHVIKKIIKEYGSIISAKDVLTHVLTIDPEKELLGYSVRYLYKLDIIRKYNIRFDHSLRISEDYKFIIEYLIKASNLAVLEDEFYSYFVNGSSTTGKYVPTLHEDMDSVNHWIIDNVYAEYSCVVNEHAGCIANTYLNFVQNIAKPDSGYGYSEMCKKIYDCKREFSYMQYIRNTLKNLHCRKKVKIALAFFAFNLDCIYALAYRLKKG